MREVTSVGDRRVGVSDEDREDWGGEGMTSVEL
jgi:hypothetical protein